MSGRGIETESGSGNWSWNGKMSMGVEVGGITSI